MEALLHSCGTIMDDVDYPTVASTVPVLDWDSILYLPTYEQMLANNWDILREGLQYRR
jgi:hypothetical protein